MYTGIDRRQGVLPQTVLISFFLFSRQTSRVTKHFGSLAEKEIVVPWAEANFLIKTAI